MGKGKDPSEDAQDHQSTPLSSLKDPSSFGPPPKRVPGQALPPPSSLRANTGGLGAPLTQDEIQAGARRRKAEEQEAAASEVEEAQTRAGPYRRDTTGLTTAGLPKPPLRRPDQPSSPIAGQAKPPVLPPRLPPRNTRGLVEPAPPPYSSAPTSPTGPPERHLNQGAMSRLGQAGISVPGFNIGRTASPPVPARHNNISPPIPSKNDSAPPLPSPSKSGAQLGELQARFAKLNTAPSSASSGTTSSTSGTTWAQKQAALRTASDFKKDPASVSLSDARVAASTANDFRERHGEQAAAGYKAAGSMNERYGIMDKMKGFSGGASGTSESRASPTLSAFGGAVKKAAPPPPAKKRELMGEAPSVPLGSKPKPSG